MIGILNVTNCCVGAQLFNFGGSPNNYSDTVQDKASMLKEIANLVKNHRSGLADLSRMAIVTAYVTTDQVLAGEVLKEIGFEPSKPFSKSKHPESDLVLWVMEAPVLYKWAIAHLSGAKDRSTKVIGVTKNPPPGPAVPVAAVVEWDENFEEEDM